MAELFDRARMMCAECPFNQPLSRYTRCNDLAINDRCLVTSPTSPCYVLRVVQTKWLMVNARGSIIVIVERQRVIPVTGKAPTS